MNILIAAIGSLGDLNPFLSTGIELDQRGHEVTIITSSALRNHVYDAGLKFLPALSEEQYAHFRALPTDVNKGQEDLKALLHIALPSTYQTARHIVKQYIPGETIAIGVALQSFGVQLAQAKTHIPILEAKLAPKTFVIEDGAKQLFNAALEKTFYALAYPLGITLEKKDWWEWMKTFDRSIGFYPDWFANAPNITDSSRAITTHFPFHDLDDEKMLPARLESFLAQGEPPIGFTFGSYVASRPDLFSAAIAACTRLHKRGVILTQYTEQLPAPLPANLCHADFVSLRKLCPRLSALVHHGGIGTAAQAFRAGIPQLACPMAFDQFENAERITNLGVGLHIKMTELTVDSLTKKLSALTQTTVYRDISIKLAQKFPTTTDSGIKIICDKIESIAAELGVLNVCVGA